MFGFKIGEILWGALILIVCCVAFIGIAQGIEAGEKKRSAAKYEESVKEYEQKIAELEEKVKIEELRGVLFHDIVYREESLKKALKAKNICHLIYVEQNDKIEKLLCTCDSKKDKDNNFICIKENKSKVILANYIVEKFQTK